MNKGCTMQKLNHLKLLVILLGVGLSGCASSGGRSTTLIQKLTGQTQFADTSVTQALDAKDQIHKLIKQNEYYDNKEIKLINSLN